MAGPLRLAVLALVVAGLAALPLAFDVGALWNGIVSWLRALGPAAAAVFVGIYVTTAVLLIPSTMLDFGAGAIFGVVWGSVLVSLAALAAATASFVTARLVGREWLLRRLAADPRFARLDEAVRREGWKIVILARLSPIFPFWLLNYGFGLTRLPLGHFVLATWLGMLPLVVLYVWTGSVVTRLAGTGQAQTLEWVLYGTGLAATAALTVVVTRMARRVLV